MSRCYKVELIIKNEKENYSAYFDRLYQAFVDEILNKITLNGKQIKVREYPPEGLTREEAFYHLTCVDYKVKNSYRQPDFHRSERIGLIPQIIANVNKCPCTNQECGSILLWKKQNNSHYRYHMFLQDEDYLVVLEDRHKYYLLVTAFWVSPLNKQKYLDEYDKYKVDQIP